MKSFSELTSASQVNNEDLLAISQTSGSGYASKKTTVKDITDKSNLNLAEEYDSTSTYAVDDYVIYESVLYKCIGTTTGTFDSTKWTSVVVTDEMGSGGGGGTTVIANPQGTPTDNLNTIQIGNEIFNIVGGGGDYYAPVIYSTEEREIGVWTDGKPLYQKTCQIVSNTSVGAWTTITLTSPILNPEYIVKAEFNDGTPSGYGQKTYLFRADGGNVQVKTTDGSTTTFNAGWRFTLWYTKTTDVAGSGSWTPQGVPAHHYSTDEHIVGTWIDGSTLYEKTVSFTTGSDGAYNTYDTGILNPDTIMFDFNASYYETSNAKVQALSYWGEIPSSGYSNAFCILANKVDNKIRIDYRVGSTASGKTAYVTIRYTKSS